MAAAWIIMQAVGFVEAPLRLPPWADTLAIVLLIAGLPVALILAWAQETQAPATDDVAEPKAARGLSIAVLPFDNLSGDEEFGYLADGLVDEVITILAQNPSFFVIARNTMFTYKGQAVNVQDVARELGVAYVIEGSVRQAGTQMRINVQLIEAETGAHAWSERFLFDVSEIFDIQDKMIEGIAAHLGDEVMAAELTKLKARPTNDLGAWELFIRTSDWRRDGTRATEPLLRQALKRDPDFAAAMATLALVLMISMRIQGVKEETLKEALTLAERALSLAQGDPLVMTPVAQTLAQLGQHERALQMIEAALLKAPGLAMCHATHAAINLAMGEAREALQAANRALELSPRDMAASAFLVILGNAEMLLGNLEASLAHARNAQKFASGTEQHWGVATTHANVLALMGRTEEAREVYATGRRAHPDASIEGYVQSINMAMKEPVAEKLLEGLRKAGIVE